MKHYHPITLMIDRGPVLFGATTGRMITECNYMIEISKTKNPEPKGIPLIIGGCLKPCPACGNPLSFAYDHYFCRNQNCSFNGNNED